MPTLFDSLVDRGAAPALVGMLAFAEARQNVIAQNVANLGVPGYQTQQLDPGAFQAALRTALEQRSDDPAGPLQIESTAEFGSNADGTLWFKPSERPQNVLFHDGTNMSIERQMSELAETGMMHETAATLLRVHMDNLRKAIRGRV